MKLPPGIRRLFQLPRRGRALQADIDEELRFHLEMRRAELEARSGLPPEQAGAEALRTFGNLDEARAALHQIDAQTARERHRRDIVHQLISDVRYALRSFARSRGFTLTAALTLALGVGLTATVFAVVNGVLLRPLPYRDANRLAMIWLTGPDVVGLADELPLSSGIFLELERASSDVARLAAFRAWGYTLGAPGAEPEPLEGARVSPQLFGILGVAPLHGRAFEPDEAGLGAPHVAILSYDLWQRRFGGLPSTVGSRVMLNGEPFTVVGVMPRGFTFPRGAELPGGFQFGNRTQIWTPLVYTDDDRKNYGTLNLAAVARPKDGVGMEQMRQRFATTLASLLAEGGHADRLKVRIVGLSEQAGHTVRRGLLVLMGAVALVLLIACGNVANLLVARTTARNRELAVRSALGAGRSRIIAQLVTENIVLTAIGATLGAMLATWGVRVLLGLVPGTLPRADDVAIDWRVIAATAAVAAAAGVAFGIGSAFTVARGQLSDALRGGADRATSGRERRLGRQLLTAGEVALSLVLLTGAALLAESFLRLQRVDPGFSSEHVLTANVALPIAGNFDPQHDGPRWSQFFTDLTTRLNSQPGIVAGAVSSLPLTGANESGGVRVDGEPEPPPLQQATAEYNVVSGRYFDAMGIRVIEGRAFDSRDRADAPPVVIVNREFVRRHIRSGSAMGRRVRTGFDFNGGAWREIVGVVDNVKQLGLDADDVPQAYVVETQMPYPSLYLTVRVAGDPNTALPVVKRELAAIDRSIALASVRPMADVTSESLARQRFSMILLTAFAAAALALAFVGLYGVIALGIAQRRRELGVRMALGASPRDLLGLVLGEGARVTAIGIAAGVAGALALTRVLRSLVYDVSVNDPLTLVVAAAAVAAVALLATYIPARQVARAAPTDALRLD